VHFVGQKQGDDEIVGSVLDFGSRSSPNFSLVTLTPASCSKETHSNPEQVANQSSSRHVEGAFQQLKKMDLFRA